MRIAVIGTGIMGAGMARSLAREGHEVVVWNRTASKAEAVAEGTDEIEAVADVAAAVRGSGVVISVLFDTDAVLSVTNDLVGALDPDAVWLQTSTVGPDGVRRIAEAVPGAAAQQLVDAPVLGTRKPAEDGTLVVLAAGDPAAIECARPALEAIGSRTVRAGAEVGRASALKLACNSWVALVNAGTAQALALASGQGVEPELFLEAIKGGAVDTPYAHLKGSAMLTGNFSQVSFEVDGVRKDLTLMLEAASEADVSDGLLAALLGCYDRASEKGHGSDDMSAVRTAFDA